MTQPPPQTRREHDSLGAVSVPRHALWGPQTQRAIENFPVSGIPVDARVISALALIKAAAARVNAAHGLLTGEQAAAIGDAAREIADGEHADAFPVDVFQTGSGTSTNMNVNEVIARLCDRAGVSVHPNDHVNASQSSNDVFPSAMHIAAALAVHHDLIPALGDLEAALHAKSVQFAGYVKAGRTHLMDATPITLGQEFGGYAATAALANERLRSVLPRVQQLPLGGTAVGTGLNAPAGYAAAVRSELSRFTALTWSAPRDHIEAQSTRDSLVELSGGLRTIAVGLSKICNDLRWMSSGPATGLAEIRLPSLQPGSSIMPGKVNPVLPEAGLQVCAQVIGNDAVIAWAGAAGNFELNVMMPVLARNLLESIQLLAAISALLARRCIPGISADPDRLRHLAGSSPAIVTALNGLIGYDAAARIAKHALEHGITIREATLALGYLDSGQLSEEQLDAALDLREMTQWPR
ncbi:class II fumarate hydratase [Nostocoides sp.]|uniref:class II fumarate hydratase n=1 Tax=Nostocoides sp. TaxID=1917966 RepID=UPI002CEE8931|nr:class II fumarate hydratase [Tetrasphaera sp.]